MSVENEINQLINQIYTVELVLKTFHARPRKYEGVLLYDSEAHTLEVIAGNEGISQTQLGELTFRTKGATSIMVDKLIEKGLICQQRIKSNRRCCALTLTDLGHAVNQAHMAYDAAHAKMVAESVKIDEASLHSANQILTCIIDFYTNFPQTDRIDENT